MGSELLIDYIKHFFITRLNKLSTNLYIGFKMQIYMDVIGKSLRLTKEEVRVMQEA